MPANPRADVLKALFERGFTRDNTESIYDRYRGEIRVLDQPVPIIVDIYDWDFVSPPKIRLSEGAVGFPPGSPHIESDRGICFAGGARSPVFDSHRPGGTVVACLERARSTLEDVAAGRVDHEIADEFLSYWVGSAGRILVYWDFPADFVGFCSFLELPTWNGLSVGIATTNDRLFDFFVRLRDERMKATTTIQRQALVIPVKGSANVVGGVWPPITLSQILSWLEFHDADAVTKIRNSIGAAGIAFSSGQSGIRLGVNPIVLLQFDNGVFGFEVEVEPAYKAAKDITRSHESFGRHILRRSGELEVLRIIGKRMSPSFVSQRNIEGEKNFADLKVALVGCGAIGSHLSRYLVQAGAGDGDRGELLLVDNQILDPGNIGRHALGYRYLGFPKAVACCEALKEDFPAAKVLGVNRSAMTVTSRLEHFDIVIDATGEEGLSLALNRKFVALGEKSPIVVYVWLEGNGVTTGGLIYTGPDHACLRCLWVEIDKDPMYPLLNKQAEVRTAGANACGDSEYTPYSVASSVSAAGLGLEMALDAINCRASPRFRSRILRDPRKEARKQPQKDISPAGRCPACQNSNPSG